MQEDLEDDEIYEHKDEQVNMPEIHRGAAHISSKQPINYKGIFVGDEDFNNVYIRNCAFTSKLDIIIIITQ